MRDPVRRGRAWPWHSWAKASRASAFGITALTFALSGCTSQAGGTSLASDGATPPRQTTSAIPSRTASPNSSGLASPAASAPVAPKRQESIAIGGDERVVDLFVPPTPNGEQAPLLLLLHASGESPFVMAQESGAGELAAREGVIVALPPARNHRWDGMVSSGDPITPSADAAYLVGLIEHLAGELPVDRRRVFVAGFSIGAVMTERIGCEHADKVTAIALDAGAPWSDDCAPSRPLPVLVLHGTEDSTFRIALGTQVVDRWRAIDGCAGNPIATRLSDIATAEVESGCRASSTVEFVRYAGATHRWFTNPNATAVIWSFFAVQAPR